MAVPLVDCPSTQVIGNNDQSLQLSSRLAKKLSKQVTHSVKRYISSLLQVLVSFNLEDDILFTPMVIG